ncbi:MAG: hypothetical protein JWM49_2908 [Microbacteriaceae bacterium]|nr:hypothetical protein [Microbacteriaceae bacterium]
MRRIVVHYGNNEYSLSGRDLEEVKAEIEDAVGAGRPLWLRVNHGEGTYRAADILITAATPIALLPGDSIEPESP